MAERIKLDNPDESTGVGTKIGKGVYLNDFEIKSVEDKSNYPGSNEPMTFFKSEKKAEIYVILHMDDVAKGAEKQMHLFGKFKKEKDTDKIIGWDAWQNGVQRLLYKVLGNQAELDPTDFSIPKDVIQKLIGKKIRVISFITDRQYEGQDGSIRYSYDMFPKVFPADATDQEVEEEWRENVQWYLDNGKYHPEIVDQLQTSFNYGANVKSGNEDEDSQPNYDQDLDEDNLI